MLVKRKQKGQSSTEALSICDTQCSQQCSSHRGAGICQAAEKLNTKERDFFPQEVCDSGGNYISIATLFVKLYI